MRLSNKPKWKRIVIAIACFLALASLVSGSYAAYTSQAFKRGVARNKDTETIRFTSNYLQNCASGTNSSNYTGRTVLYTADDKEKLSVSLQDVYIYNYANGGNDDDGNDKLVSQRDITYNLTIKFSGGSGSGYKVTTSNEAEVISGADNTFTVNQQTLTGVSPKWHMYTFTFPGSDIDKLKITITAVPTNLSVTNNQILAGIIAPCTGSKIEDFHSAGRFIDEADGTSPKQYDGFNYEISISRGSATGRLEWKKGIVEIDPFFLVNLGKNQDEIKQILEEGCLTIEMSLSNGTGNYLIPFYIKNKTEIPDNWPAMYITGNEIIKFSAKEITDSSDTSTTE